MHRSGRHDSHLWKWRGFWFGPLWHRRAWRDRPEHPGFQISVSRVCPVRNRRRFASAVFHQGPRKQGTLCRVIWVQIRDHRSEVRPRRGGIGIPLADPFQHHGPLMILVGMALRAGIHQNRLHHRSEGICRRWGQPALDRHVPLLLTRLGVGHGGDTQPARLRRRGRFLGLHGGFTALDQFLHARILRRECQRRLGFRQGADRFPHLQEPVRQGGASTGLRTVRLIGHVLDGIPARGEGLENLHIANDLRLAGMADAHEAAKAFHRAIEQAKVIQEHHRRQRGIPRPG